MCNRAVLAMMVAFAVAPLMAQANTQRRSAESCINAGAQRGGLEKILECLADALQIGQNGNNLIGKNGAVADLGPPSHSGTSGSSGASLEQCQADLAVLKPLEAELAALKPVSKKCQADLNGLQAELAALTPPPAPAAACFSTQKWKTDMQRVNPHFQFLTEVGADGWCPLLGQESECNAHGACFWGASSPPLLLSGGAGTNATDQMTSLTASTDDEDCKDDKNNALITAVVVLALALTASLCGIGYLCYNSRQRGPANPTADEIDAQGAVRRASSVDAIRRASSVDAVPRETSVVTV